MMNTVPPEEYPVRLRENGPLMHELRYYRETPRSVWIEGNAYAGYATPFRAEAGAIVTNGMSASVEERNGEWILTLNIPASVAEASCAPVTTERLGAPRITEERYENPDGTPIDFTADMVGAHRSAKVVPGPFATLSAGEQSFVVWKT